jgi:predicted permease
VNVRAWENALLQTWIIDVRHAWLGLCAAPGLAAAAIATIALGIGVNTGIFSLFNALALRDLPVPGAGELVTINQSVSGVERGSNNFSEFSTAEYEIYRDRSQTLAGVAGYARYWAASLGPESTRVVVTTPVTCDYFDVLRVQPTFGTGFAARHCEAGGDSAVAVLTHDLWVTRFGADPAILGRTVTLNGAEFTVIGVAPEGFAGVDIERVALFVPVAAQNLLRRDRDYFGTPSIGWLGLVGRRDPAASLEQVRADLAVVAGQLDQEQPGRQTTVTVSRATPLSATQMRDGFFAVSPLVMAPFGLVLLVACMNVANLLLVRGESRAREIAIKLSLGATRGHLVRQLMTESVAIAVVGGLIGTLLAVWVFDAVLTLLLGSLPADLRIVRVDSTLDVRVLSFALLVSFTTGLVFGVLPALRATKPNLRTTIEQGAAGSGRNTRGRLQRVIVGAQVAFSMVLVVTTALLLRGLYVAQTVDFGFEYRDVTVATYDLQGFGYVGERAAAFQQQVIERARGIPGVEDVALAVTTPLAPGSNTIGYRLPDQDEFIAVDTNIVSANYFSLLGIPIVRGRTFTDAEIASPTITAMIVTQSTAQRFWPNQDPLGQRLVFRAFEGDRTVDIVGVAADRQVVRIGETDTSYIYGPAVAPTLMAARLVVRSSLDVALVQKAVEDIVLGLDPTLDVAVAPLEENFEFWRRFSRIAAGLGSALGALALALAAIGIFGVMSAVVVGRTREIGLRLALGAAKRDILRLVLGKSMVPVAVGALAGCGACIGAARLLKALLYGISAVDPYALGSALLLVLSIGALAAVIPARRAMILEPLTTLRYE